MKKGNQSITGDIVKEYLDRFQKIPSLTLAKKIYTENSVVFTDIDHARGLIRYYRGQLGNKARSELGTTKYIKEAGKLNPFEIPESDAEVWAPVHIPERYNNGLIMADLHSPYHDVQAITSMINYTLQHKKINFILINGDGMDFYQGSRFINDPRKRSINDEYWIWVEFLNILQTTFPGIKIYWKLGNHESRMENYLRVKAPQLMDMEEFKCGEIIKIRGIQDVEVIDKQIIYAGRLPILHGHEFQSGIVSPVNPARGLFLKTLSSAVSAHQHRTSAHSETDINEKLMSWWSMGCLCGLHPEYARINKWNHGFSYIETEGKEFTFENMKCYKGKIYKD